MKAFIISDGDFQTDTFRRLEKTVKNHLAEKNFDVTEKRIGRDELAYCMGCFGCWVKKPGECVINDAMTEINRNSMTSDVVIYLSPVIFGQFSANIKSAVDRWIPNILPFFVIRPDGSTMHPPRYETYPKTIMIGYGEDLTEEDTCLFRDITKKHRRNVDVLIYKGDDETLADAWGTLALSRVGGQL